MSALEWIDAAQQRCDAATEGPWEWDEDQWLTAPSASVVLPGDEVSPDQVQWLDVRPADAEFIAASRTTLPAALAALREVLELHHSSDVDVGFCDQCTYAWPCLTVHAITEALGVQA